MSLNYNQRIMNYHMLSNLVCQNTQNILQNHLKLNHNLLVMNKSNIKFDSNMFDNFIEMQNIGHIFQPSHRLQNLKNNHYYMRNIMNLHMLNNLVYQYKQNMLQLKFEANLQLNHNQLVRSKSSIQFDSNMFDNWIEIQNIGYIFQFFDYP